MAYKEEDLEQFYSKKDMKYGKANICKECNSAKQRDDYKSHKYKQKLQTRKRYGIEYEEYEKRMETSHCCEACGREENLVYDHDHTTMEFRGVLCRTCNAGLGQLGDTLEAINKMVTYLKKRRK